MFSYTSCTDFPCNIFHHAIIMYKFIKFFFELALKCFTWAQQIKWVNTKCCKRTQELLFVSFRGGKIPVRQAKSIVLHKHISRTWKKYIHWKKKKIIDLLSYFDPWSDGNFFQNVWWQQWYRLIWKCFVLSS